MPGASVAFVGAVGNDGAGRLLLDVLDGEGIDRSGVVVSAARPTGRAVIVVDDGGENTIVVVAGANEEAVAIESLTPVSCSPSWRSRCRPSLPR